MRAMKKTVSLLLALVMVLGMMTMAVSVSAAETNTITAKSNIASDYTINYYANSTQVTVTYSFQTALPVVNVEGYITYDSSILTLNKVEYPNLKSVTSNTTLTDEIAFNCSNPTAPYDFSKEAVLVNLVFDIKGTGATTVNFNLKNLKATKAADPTKSSYLDDVKVIANSAVTGDAAFTAKATETVDGSGLEDASVFIQDVRIALEGKIGLNYYLRANPTGYDSSKITVEFKGENAEQNKTVALDSLRRTTRQSELVRVNTYYVYSFMMTQPVTVNFYNDGELVATDKMSVKDWTDAHVSEFEESNPAAVKLIKSMLNYGAASQRQFGEYTDSYADEGNDLALEKITADKIVVSDGLNVTPDLSGINASFYRQTVELKEGVGIRIYVRANNADTFNGKVSTLGKDMPFAKGSGSYFMASYDDIMSFEMDTDYTFTFSNGATYKTSVMSYVKDLLARSAGNENVENLVSAMYWYNQAANAVFE